MARWQLVTGHYIHVAEPIEWEKVETDQDTGRQNRKRYIVPLYIPAERTVCQGRGSPGDVEFLGEPTPDMTPLDDEAEEISAKHRHKWQMSDYGVGSEAVMEALSMQLAKSMAQGTPVQNVGGVSSEAFAELQGTVKALMEQNAQLLAQLGKSSRRM